MGQSSSTSLSPNLSGSDRRQLTRSSTATLLRRSRAKSTALISPILSTSDSSYANDHPYPKDHGHDHDHNHDGGFGGGKDYTYDLPDECLASIFHSLGSGDRNSCSLVCRRWLLVEAQSRHRISLSAHSALLHAVPALFDRFDSVTKLALKCDRRSDSIGDDALALISLRCRSLTRLKLRSCRDITDEGMAAFAANCTALKKFSCGSCTFGAKGMNAVLDNCPGLEELSVKRLRGITDRNSTDPIGPGAAAASLRVICLKELYNGQCFGPLIMGSKSLKTLKLYRCSGDWDALLLSLVKTPTLIAEIHLERLQVSDVGLGAISSCPNLDILHLVKTPECTNLGIVTVAENCKLLRKLHIDGWKANRIGDQGLIAVAKNCPNLQELVLIGVNPTRLSLDTLASNCQKLERLALCGSETVGDPEISCIAAKCNALKKLCIKNCPVSDHGMEALAGGCPNLVKIKVKKCRAVTCEGADWLRTTRGSLAVNLDMGESDQPDANASDEAPGNAGGEDLPQVNANANAHNPARDNNAAVLTSSGSVTGRSTSFKSRLSLLSGRNFVACTLRRWSSTNARSSSTATTINNS